MKTLIILRGVSGSGKSSVASWIKQSTSNWKTLVCSADDYFINSKGEYVFEQSKLKDAHAHCMKTFKSAVEVEMDTIVLSNTNTSPWEFEEYEKHAKENGYTVFHLVVENRHGNSNVHGCPSDVQAAQRKRLLESLSL